MAGTWFHRCMRILVNKLQIIFICECFGYEIRNEYILEYIHGSNWLFISKVYFI